MTTRRDFLRALGLGAALIAVPQYGRWHRQGSGVLVPPPSPFPWEGTTFKVALFDSSGIEYGSGNYASKHVLPTGAKFVDGVVQLELPPVTWAALDGDGAVSGYALVRESDGLVVDARSLAYPFVPNGGDVTLRWNP